MPRWTTTTARIEVAYWLILVLSAIGTWHSWSAGGKYNLREDREVRMIDGWSYLSGNKTSVEEHWKGEFIDLKTGTRFVTELTPQFYNLFTRGERKPINTSIEFDIGRFDPDLAGMKQWFAFYRFLTTMILVVLVLRPLWMAINRADRLDW